MRKGCGTRPEAVPAVAPSPTAWSWTDFFARVAEPWPGAAVLQEQ